MLQLHRKEFSVTLEVITQSHILSGQQNPALLCPTCPSSFSVISLTFRAALCINTNSRFGWNVRLIQKSLSVSFHKSACRLTTSLPKITISPYPVIYIMLSKFYYGWMCQCHSYVLLFISRFNKSTGTDVTIKAIVFKGCDRLF